MGLALVIGVATKIYVNKKGEFREYSKEEIINKLKESININFYNVEEEEKELVLSIKDEIFVNNIYDLLVSETKNFKLDGRIRDELNEALNKINKAKNVNEIEKIVEEDRSCVLHMMTGCPWETISYISDGDLCIVATLLTYSYTYKVFLECYNSLFRYLRAKLQEAIDNPLKDDVFLMITTG